MKKIIEYLWYIVITAAIWGTNLGGIYINGLGTMSPFRIIIVILLMILIFSDFKNRRKIEKSNIILFGIAMVILTYNLFFMLNNNDIITSIQKILNYAYGLILIIIGKRIVTEDKILNNTIKVILINFIIICLWGFYESFTGNYVFPVNEKSGMKLNSFGLYPPIVAFFNTNGLATFCVMMLPCIYSYQIFNNKNFSMIIKWILVIVSMILCLLAGARAACMILLAFILVRAFVNVKNKEKFLLVGLALIIILTVSSSIWKQPVDSIMKEIFSVSMEDNSTNIRVNIIKNGFQELRESNYMGIGIGNFEKIMENYDNTSGIVNAHNLILEVLVENGIIMFVLIATTFLNIGIKLIKKYKRQNEYGKNIIINMLFLIVTFPLSTSINSSSFAFMPMWIMITIFTIFAHNKFIETNIMEETK